MTAPASPAPPVPAPLPEDTQRRIDGEQVAALYRQTPVGLVGGWVFACLLAWSLAMIDATSAWFWLALKCLVIGGRTADWLAWQRRGQQADAPRHWRWRHGLGSGLDGLSWGLVAVLFLPSIDGWRDGLLVAGLLGIASLGMSTLSAVSSHAVRFMAGTLLPLVLTQLPRWPEPDAVVMSLGIVIYLVVVHREGRQAEARHLELVRLRFHNAEVLTQLAAALETARQSEATKTRFLATVSHELRTPLNGIVGMTQLLEHAPHLPAQAHRLGVIRQCADHLQVLINDVLDLSRMEFGRLPLAPVPTDLARLVRTVAELMHGVARERGLQLTVTVAPDLPPACLIDPVRVRQILLNLVGNALKFTPDGRVSVGVAPAPGDPDRLRIDVQDGGPGVPATDRERIFEAFEQGAEGVRAGQSGSGLGLTIARQLARAMGGSLDCIDGERPGGCFVLTLPCIHAPLPPPEAPAKAMPAGPPRAAHVLVVEDHPVNADITLALLEQLGHCGTVAVNGREALDLLQRPPRPDVDLVLMDGQMPVMDGWTAARQWRDVEERTPGRPRLPIVALTANASDDDRARCLAAGMDDLLAKPYTRDQLAAVVDRWQPRRPASG